MVTYLFLLLLAIWLGLCIGCIFRAELCVLLVLSLYAVEQVLYFGLPGLIPTSGVKIAVGVCTLASLLTAFLRGRARFDRVPRLVIYTSVFFILAAIATIWGPDENAQRIWFREYAPYAITFWFIAPFCLSQPIKLSWLFNAMTYFGGLVFTCYLFCNIGSRGIVVELGREDFTMNPLPLATYAAITIIAIVFSLYRTKSPWAVLLLVAIISVLCMYAIVRGGSRGQFFGLLVSLAIWLPITVKTSLNRSLFVAILICIAIGALAYQVVFTYGLQYGSDRWALEGMRDSFDLRVSLVDDSMKLYSQGGAFSWLFGLGYASLRELLGTYPHNVPIEVLVELGLVGFFLYLTIILGSLRLGWMLLKNPLLTGDERICVGFTMCIFTLLTFLSWKEGTYLRGETFLASSMISWLAFSSFRSRGYGAVQQILGR